MRRCTLSNKKKDKKAAQPSEPVRKNLEMVDGHYPVIDLCLAEVVFPTDVLHLMPEYTGDFESTWGRRTFEKWFFQGLKAGELVPKEGINIDKALRHLKAVIGSFNHKHEHKEEAAARLLEDWFQPPKEDSNATR